MSKVGDLPVRILAEALTLLGMLNEPWVLFGIPLEDWGAHGLFSVETDFKKDWTPADRS